MWYPVVLIATILWGPEEQSPLVTRARQLTGVPCMDCAHPVALAKLQESVGGRTQPVALVKLEYWE